MEETEEDANGKISICVHGCSWIGSILLKDLYALSIAVVYYLKITDKDIQ